jgi:hypothetical protein
MGVLGWVELVVEISQYEKFVANDLATRAAIVEW